MDCKNIYYVSQPPSQRTDPHLLRLSSTFSSFVSHHVNPPPVQPYISTLREQMGSLIGRPRFAPRPHTAPAVKVEHPAPVTVSASAPTAFTPAPAFAPGPVTVTSVSTLAQTPVHPPVDALCLTSAAHAVVAPSHHPPSAPVSVSPWGLTPVYSAPIALAVSMAATAAPPAVAPAPPVAPAPKKAAPAPSKFRMGTIKDPCKPPTVSPEKAERIADVKSTVSTPAEVHVSSPSMAAPASDPTPANPRDSTSAANSLISKILSLVELVQNNTMKFYIYVTGEDSENRLCTEIKVGTSF